VPTYTKSQITALKNNYNGATPDPGYISGWNLTIDGLDSGLSISLDVRNLMNLFSMHEQITRLVCVEGWSAIAWWAGFRFDDLLRASHRCRRQNGRAWSRRSTSMTREILTLTSCQSTWVGPPSANTACDTFQRPAAYCRSWSTTPSAGARETWFEECKGHYQDYLFRGRAKRLLGRTWLFALRRNLKSLHAQFHSAVGPPVDGQDSAVAIRNLPSVSI